MRIRAELIQKRSVCLLLAVLLSGVMLLSGCISTSQHIEMTEVNSTFEEDYLNLKKVAEYLMSLDYRIVTIRNDSNPMIVDFGEEIAIENKEIRAIISDLFQKGYSLIIRNDTTVKFERWEKPFDMEFHAGFAYDYDNMGDLNIQYVIRQKELAEDNWYYFEVDYNEWRSSH